MIDQAPECIRRLDLACEVTCVCVSYVYRPPSYLVRLERTIASQETRKGEKYDQSTDKSKNKSHLERRVVDADRPRRYLLREQTCHE